jgi:streptomycin 3"-adenylyltransferase
MTPGSPDDPRRPTPRRETPPPTVLAWAQSLAGRVDSASGGDLAGAYLHGSAVLGGWRPDRSDVDVLFVAGREPSAGRLAVMADALTAVAPGCPGTGLECSVVTAAYARRPTQPWPFVLHVRAEAGGALGIRVVHGDTVAGDEDLLMHYVVCRSTGWALHGRPPRELIGEVARPAILGYLADELGWGLANAPEPYAVLNACRALVFAADGRIVGKVAGGQAALDRGLGPAAVLRRAPDQQLGRRPVQPPAADAAAFVTGTAAALRATARPARPDAPRTSS